MTKAENESPSLLCCRYSECSDIKFFLVTFFFVNMLKNNFKSTELKEKRKIGEEHNRGEL